MKNKFFVFIVVIAVALVVILAIGLLYSMRKPVATINTIGNAPEVGGVALDSFAQCLAKKNITMYGAEWCPHCQAQKALFGSSFKFVPYVECPSDPKRCLAAGIKGYPTWIFPDGRRFEGEQPLATLAQNSGCSLIVVK